MKHHNDHHKTYQRISATYITGPRPEQQQIEGDGCHGVDEEPAFHVVDGYLLRVRDDLAVVEVRGTEVNEDIRDEHDVNDQINDD